MLTTTGPAKRTHNEDLKENNPLLTGAISQTLADPTQDCFTHDDYEFLKFHGVYQQDDRDKRKAGKHYIFMVRTKFPGGAISPDQYLTCDRLAREYGYGTLRITTRQDFQFHGVIKANLRKTIKELNEAMMSTIAACGDVERNVMAPPTPATSPLVEHVLTEARRLSNALAPKTPAYHKIWLEGEELNLSDPAQRDFVDPLYGKQYLPRKFKTAFAIPPLNDVDIFTNDLGFIVIAEGDRLLGYNVVAGGGLGMSHGNAQTYPRLADMIGFVEPQHLETMAKAILTVHRDFGDRTNRKHARLKYVIEEKGVEWFKAQVEERAGLKLQPPRPYTFTGQSDVLGWHRQTDGRWFLGLFVENGRIKDVDGYQLMTGLRRVVGEFRPEVRLTASQNLLLVNVRDEDRAALGRVLAEHGVSVENPFSKTRLASMACPAMPTCGLALAESERAMPEVLTRIEVLLKEVGLDDEEIVIRMTGCPNGCARPYMAEVAFVGKAPGRYQLYLGGNEACTRLNRVYKESVRSEEIEAELRPLLSQFKDQRGAGERFGDWCHRVVLAEAATTAT